MGNVRTMYVPTLWFAQVRMYTFCLIQQILTRTLISYIITQNDIYLIIALSPRAMEKKNHNGMLKIGTVRHSSQIQQKER